MSINTDRDQRRAAGDLTVDQVRLLQRMLENWRVRDWKGGIAVRAAHLTDATQREEYGRASMVSLRRRGLVVARVVDHTQEWFLTQAGRERARTLAR